MLRTKIEAKHNYREAKNEKPPKNLSKEGIRAVSFFYNDFHDFPVFTARIHKAKSAKGAAAETRPAAVSLPAMKERPRGEMRRSLLHFCRNI